jgi:hypothetical protein
MRQVDISQHLSTLNEIRRIALNCLKDTNCFFNITRLDRDERISEKDADFLRGSHKLANSLLHNGLALFKFLAFSMTFGQQQIDCASVFLCKT